MNLLGWREIREKILKTSIFLLLIELGTNVVFLLNCDNTHWQNVFLIISNQFVLPWFVDEVYEFLYPKVEFRNLGESAKLLPKRHCLISVKWTHDIFGISSQILVDAK